MFYFGIDVSRDKLDCAAVDEKGQRIKRARTFANDTQGVNEMIGWARAAACEEPCCFVMEATAAGGFNQSWQQLKQGGAGWDDLKGGQENGQGDHRCARQVVLKSINGKPGKHSGDALRQVYRARTRHRPAASPSPWARAAFDAGLR